MAAGVGYGLAFALSALGLAGAVLLLGRLDVAGFVRDVRYNTVPENEI